MIFLSRLTHILDFVLSALMRRKAKNISLVLVYAFVVFLVASAMFLTTSMKREAALTLRNAPEITVQRLMAGRQELVPLSYIPAIEGIRGVQSVKPRLWGYYYDVTSGANYTVMVNADLADYPGSVAVGSGVARTIAADDGRAPLRAADGGLTYFRIKATLASDSELETSDLILMNEADFRKLMNFPEGFATDLVLKVRNAKEYSTIAGKITRALPDTRPILRDELLRTYDTIFSWRGGVAIVILSGAILAFIILAWDKATGLSVEEKREIGILKATGWDTSDVLLMKFWEGAAISLTAFFFGVMGAYLHVYLGGFVLFEPALKGWSVLYPQFRLTPFFGAYDIATLLFLTVVPYTVATIVPSWRAATIDPDAVMRA